MAHVAELVPVEHGGPATCRIVRIVELSGSTITGAGHHADMSAMTNTPNPVVPCPSTYDSYPDLEAQWLTESDFEKLWNQAIARFPHLKPQRG